MIEFDSEVITPRKKEVKINREWWNSLSDEEKYLAYKHEKEFGESEEKTLDAIVEHLLGKHWYACDTGGYREVNPIIINTIKEEFPCAENLYCSHRFKKFIKWLFR